MTMLLVSKSCSINGVAFYAGDQVQYEGDPKQVYYFFITRKPTDNRSKMFEVRTSNQRDTLDLLIQKQSNNKKAMTIRNRMMLK